MKKIALIVFLSSLSFFSTAQDSVTTYYSGQRFDKIVDVEKAKYSQTITTHNGIITTTQQDLKKNTVIYRQAMKGDEPVGVWISATGRGLAERDYNFELKYGNKDCANAGALQEVSDFMLDYPAIQYTAPKLATGETNIMEFIRTRLRYPAHARRTGIQGTVDMVFTITKEGNVDDIVVTKGVHVSLDKESVRIIRLLKFRNPPMINGESQDMCVRMPIKYKLN